MIKKLEKEGNARAGASTGRKGAELEGVASDRGAGIPAASPHSASAKFHHLVVQCRPAY